jgi:hypothetical protein
MHTMQAERQQLNQSFFELRIGIHSGAVVAGIVGINHRIRCEGTMPRLEIRILKFLTVYYIRPKFQFLVCL